MDSRFIRFCHKQQSILVGILFFVVLSFHLFGVLRTPGQDQPGITTSNLGRMLGTSWALYYWKLFPVVARPVTEAFPYDIGSKAIYAPSDTRWLDPGHAASLLQLVQSNPDPMRVDILLSHEDIGIVFLTTLSAWLRGSFWPPGIRGMNVFFYALSMVILFSGFLRTKRPLLGFLLTLLLMTHRPFVQLVNIDNILAYPFLALISSAGFCMPFLFGIPMKTGEKIIRLVLALLTLLMAIQIRGLAFPVLGALVFAVLVHARSTWKQRIILSIGVLASFWVASQLIQIGIEAAQHRTTRILNFPAHLQEPPRRYTGHPIVHILWCGLGDFGRDKGYVWSDSAAYARAIKREPSLALPPKDHMERFRYGNVFRRERSLALGPDAPDVFSQPERYNHALVRIMLDDIRSDPSWYLGILLKRAHLTLLKGRGWIWLIAGLLLLVGYPFFARRKSQEAFSELKIFCFLSVFLLIPILIYSTEFTGYFLGYLVIQALCLEWGILLLLRRIPQFLAFLGRLSYPLKKA